MITALEACPQLNSLCLLHPEVVRHAALTHADYSKVVRAHIQLITPETTATIAQRFKNLIELDIYAKLSRQDQSIAPILEACVRLTALRLLLFSLHASDYEKFAHLTKLKKLWIYSSSLNDNDCEILSQSMAKSLQELRFGGISITGTGIQSFVHSNLLYLDVSATQVNVIDAGIIFRSASVFPNLTTLLVKSAHVRHFRTALDRVGRENVCVDSEPGRLFGCFQRHWKRDAATDALRQRRRKNSYVVSLT